MKFKQPRRGTSCILLLSQLGAFYLTKTTHAQLTIGIPGIFEVNLTVPDEVENFFADDDDEVENGNSSTAGEGALDFESILDAFSDFIGGNLDNFTLPPELEDIFDLPNFDNFTFSFGGNCSICDNPEGGFVGTNKLDGVSCSDWNDVATLGVEDGSAECDLIRVGAAQSCGFPVPEDLTDKTCSVCPEGEAPGEEWQASLGDEVIAVRCSDLQEAPAVDGERTCDLISRFAAECNCQPINEVNGGGENSATLESGAREIFLRGVLVGGIVAALSSAL